MIIGYIFRKQQLIQHVGTTLFRPRPTWNITGTDNRILARSFTLASLKKSKWLSWRGILFRLSPIGLCTAGAIDWYVHTREMDRQGLSRTASQWQVGFYRSLPLRLMSRTWGWIACCRVPEPARPFVYGAYASAFGVNIAEAADPDLRHYESLAEFFTRSLKEEVRPIDAKSCIVSPCDGRVLHFGVTSTERIEQVKGVSYHLQEFLGPNWITDEDVDYVQSIKTHPDTVLHHCVIYLAPGDYHRFHSPVTWRASLRRHFSGELLSVNPKIAKLVPNLFCINERALYIGHWEHGFFSFSAVGATNVGSVDIFSDETLKTNRWLGLGVGKSGYGKHFRELPLGDGIELEKGQLFGQFNMGSTIVLIFEAPTDFQFELKAGQRVKLGEQLGCFSGQKEKPSAA